MAVSASRDAASCFRDYRSIVPDWPAFLACLERPLPGALWVHPHRLGRDTVAGLLAEAGMAATPVPWAEDALRLPAASSPGNHWGFLAGLFQVQEEIAMLPARLLAARPGERVLDLCAAPGNKTAQLALAMGGRGTLCANDVQRGRLGALRQTVKRLGLSNVVTTCHPGEEYPLASGPFDRVLVDAPCSGEGTWRKGGPARGAAADLDRTALVRRQVRLLERALRLTRPGGRVVYATCTLSPAENEGVVDSVLRDWGEAVAPCPVRDRLPAALSVSPAVERWRGQRFLPGVAECLRFWPQDNDTGGFFIAVLEKRDGDAPVPEREEDVAHDTDRLAPVLARFGLSLDDLGGARLRAPTGRYASLVPADLSAPRRPPPHAVGLPALAVQTRPDKLTTAMAMAVGAQADRNAVTLSGPDAVRFLAREPVRVSADGATAVCSPGYVLVRHRGATLGLGRYRDGGRLESLYPARWSRIAGIRGLE